MASPLDPLPPSYSLICHRLSRDGDSVSFRHKTTSRADSYLSHKKALEAGYNDTLYLNDKNELLECTRANILLILEDKIITPRLDQGILSGVTRNKIFEIAKEEGIQIEEKSVHSLYLNKAKEVFISSAIIDVMPVSRIKAEDREYKYLTAITIDKITQSYKLMIKRYIEKYKQT